MTVEFKKIPVTGIHFETHLGAICFSGEALKVEKTLVRCTGTLKGDMPYSCDRCAEVFALSLNENVEVFANEGFYEDKEGEDLLNVVEFFSGAVDFTALCESEMEAFKSDYHYCGACKNNE